MNMKKTLMAAVALMGGVAMAADSTYSFTYQAALRDEHGLVISNGMSVARNHTVTLRLWDAPTDGNVLWGRTYNVYTDEMGLFNLEVTDTAGSRSPDAPVNAALESVFTNRLAGAVYIGLFVKGSSGEIVPRQRLFAVPFAAVANDVRKISGDVTVGGKITMKDNKGKYVEISATGISQGGSGSSSFQNVAANGEISASGVITAGGGLAVNGGTVSIKPDAMLDRKLTVKGATELNGGVTVSGGDLAVAAGNKVTVGGSDLLPVPVGGIILWTKAELPDKTHWAICNGQTVYGITTPDLRGRFVVGANNGATGMSGAFTSTTYNPDTSANRTGGEERHQLAAGEMPAHMHLYVAESQLNDRLGENGDWGSNALRYKIGKRYTSNIGSHPRFGYQWNSGNDQMTILETGVTGGDGTKSGNYPAEGHATSHENRPPYYALYYIMRVK